MTFQHTGTLNSVQTCSCEGCKLLMSLYSQKTSFTHSLLSADDGLEYKYFPKYRAEEIKQEEVRHIAAFFIRRHYGQWRPSKN